MLDNQDSRSPPKPLTPARLESKLLSVTIRYVPASTRIQHRDDRRQYIVRGRTEPNGNVYMAPPDPVHTASAVA